MDLEAIAFAPLAISKREKGTAVGGFKSIRQQYWLPVIMTTSRWAIGEECIRLTPQGIADPRMQHGIVSHYQQPLTGFNHLLRNQRNGGFGRVAA